MLTPLFSLYMYLSSVEPEQIIYFSPSKKMCLETGILQFDKQHLWPAEQTIGREVLFLCFLWNIVFLTLGRGRQLKKQGFL